MMKVDDTEDTRLTKEPASDRHPSWSVFIC